MKYQLVFEGPGGLQSELFGPKVDVFAAMEVRGYPFQKLSPASGPQRPALLGQPQFAGLCGPMWGGEDEAGEPILRYESIKAYAVLSA